MPGAAIKWIPKNKNCKKRFENECLLRSPGELLEAPNWIMKARKAFPCSAALVPFFAGAFPCSVALVFYFLVNIRWSNMESMRASNTSLKPMRFCIFSTSVHARSGQQVVPKNKIH